VKKLKRKGFETVIASPPEYERLLAEIYYDGLFVAQISQERGEGVFDLETPGTDLVEEMVTRKVDLHELLRAVEEACQRLRGELP
jgi:hypothetical protein